MTEDTTHPDTHTHALLRIDLQESLRHSAVDPRTLSRFQRILLTTDGTVTEILEAQFWEAIRIVKLYQELVTLGRPVPYLDLSPNARVLARKVLLQGSDSARNYIYAESLLVPERLEEKVREGLLGTRKPIGQLMIETRMETFREILACRREPAGEIGAHFGVAEDSMLISRTYRVFGNRLPVMLITEKFPETAFR